MINLAAWAQRHGVSQSALNELTQIFTCPDAPVTAANLVSEAGVQNAIRVEASNAGVRLWRNNVGACKDERGRLIRYGLNNETKHINAVSKSSDLIGISPVLITQGMVGSTIGQFIAREVKAPGWVYRATEREVAQLNFMKFVVANGGNACFANSVGTI